MLKHLWMIHLPRFHYVVNHWPPWPLCLSSKCQSQPGSIFYTGFSHYWPLFFTYFFKSTWTMDNSFLSYSYIRGNRTFDFAPTSDFHVFMAEDCCSKESSTTCHVIFVCTLLNAFEKKQKGLPVRKVCEFRSLNLPVDQKRRPWSALVQYKHDDGGESKQSGRCYRIGRWRGSSKEEDDEENSNVMASGKIFLKIVRSILIESNSQSTVWQFFIE